MSLSEKLMVIGAILFVAGMSIGIITALVLTTVERSHGRFHIMLEEEIARNVEDSDQMEADHDLEMKIRSDRFNAEVMHQMWDDAYYNAFNAANEYEDDEPEDNPHVFVADTVTTPFEPAEAVTA